MLNLPVLLFDPDCTFCVRFTQGLKLIDKNKTINFIPITEDEIYEEYPTLNFEDCSETIHFINSDKEILKGSEAISEMIKIIPAVSKFTWLIESNSASKAIEAFYTKVNDVRQSKKEFKASGCTNCGTRRSKPSKVNKREGHL